MILNLFEMVTVTDTKASSDLTAELLAEPGLKESIAKADKEIERGEVYTFEQVFGDPCLTELDLNEVDENLYKEAKKAKNIKTSGLVNI